jgi:thioredoxin reductase
VSKTNVVIAGGGMAGISCALFLGRANVPVTVFDGGRSSLRRVSRVGNYVGFPEGIGGAELLDRCRRQAEGCGAHFVDADLTAIERRGERFVVRAGNREMESTFVVLASNKSTELARALGLTLGGFGDRFLSVDAQGQTAIPGLYAVGRITGIASQAVISAGDGAKTAIALIEKIRGQYYVDHDT